MNKAEIEKLLDIRQITQWAEDNYNSDASQIICEGGRSQECLVAKYIQDSLSQAEGDVVISYDTVRILDANGQTKDSFELGESFESLILYVDLNYTKMTASDVRICLRDFSQNIMEASLLYRR